MVFLNIWGFWLGAIAPAIVLLYLLKVKRRPLAVSTLMFWQRVLQENRRRALFQRLRQLLSLLLHLLIFALVLLALARPVFDRLVRAGSSSVLVLDLRARMQATEPGGQTRFALAIEEAKRYVRQAGALRQVAILTAGAQTSVAVPFTGDEKTLREGLARLQPTDAGGDLEPALRLGRDLLASRAGERRLLVFTDRKGSDPAEYRALGTPRHNLAITQFAARALPGSPETCEVLLEVQNFSDTEAAGNVELTLDGRLLDVRPFRLAPGQTDRRTFPLVPGENMARGRLLAHLEGRDALPLDDIAYALLPIRRPIQVLLVTKGNWFLEKLLAADPRVRFELLTPESFSAEIAAKFQAVIYDDWLPSGLTLAQLKGSALFLGRTPFDTTDPEITQPVITDIDAAHPLLRAVKLEHVTVARAAAMALPKEAAGWRFEEPLRFADRPLLIAGANRPSVPEQRLAALGFRVLDSDLPLRVAFPLLISNTLQWLAGATVEETPSLRAGETIKLAEGETAFLPPERAESSLTKEQRGVFQPLANGFYALRAGPAERWVAVNTASATESDLRTSVEPAAPSGEGLSFALPRATAFLGWPLWQLLALAALLLFTGEWWLFHRRRTE